MFNFGSDVESPSEDHYQWQWYIDFYVYSIEIIYLKYVN